MIRFAATALCAFALATTAHADVYAIHFGGYEPSDPTRSPNTTDYTYDFSVDTGNLQNFSAYDGVYCGTPGYDCFANDDNGYATVVYRDGQITDGYQFSGGNIDFYASSDPDFMKPFTLFTGPDSDPQLLTGTFYGTAYFNFASFVGEIIITDTTTSAVPEPGSLALLGTGLLGGLAAVRRRIS